jgi:glutathione S-transferase
MTKPHLYHCSDARSLRCLWAVEEVGFDCDMTVLPFPPRFLAPAFKAINPLGTIPAWIENGVMMTESAAITQRVVMGTPLEVSPGKDGYFAYLNWLHRSDATLTFPLTIVLRYTRLEQGERRLMQAVEDYTAFFMGRARSVETALEDGREWLVAGRFTAADICVAYALFLASTLKLADDLGERSRAYLERCMARDGFRAARERQKQV